MLARCRGFSLIYVIVAMVGLSAMLSLGLDLGRVQLVKTELRRAADSAARAGATGLAIDSTEAIIQARRFASLNQADGKSVQLNTAQDIRIGKWDPATRTFTTGGSNPNAVRVFARKNVARGDGVPMLFASIVGLRSCNVNAESIAMLTPPVNVEQSVPATGNPFLAGMPSGSVASRNNPHNSPDFAGTTRNPRQSPLLVNMTITEGQVLSFDSISGTARHDPHLAMFNPDGQLNSIGHNTNGDENGIADVIAPINALVGVFLDDKAPSLTPAPIENLDFSTAKSRDFFKLQPKMKQIFFIGDGMNSSGQRQEFIAPKGATRLFLATWDFYEWNNNGGERDVQVIRPMRITTVK